MATVISIFNNKGGVGKTTYVFHIAHILARRGARVLLVDLDTQGNLTGYCLDERELEQAWSTGGNSVFRVVEPIIRGTGDFLYRPPSVVNSVSSSVHLVPGDLRLSDFEDLLGDSWNAARGGAEAQLRVQSALHRFVQEAIIETGATIVFIDLGPNLGALNRSALAISDFFITPMAPDLFSIQGTENLGNKLAAWEQQWRQIHENWRGEDLALPTGTPTYLGYVMQMHNIRTRSEEGMTEGWAIFGKRIEDAVQRNIVDRIGAERARAWDGGSYRLGQIPNLHSLIPYSQKARKPIFDCTGTDGLRGAHQTKAREAIELFDDIVGTIEGVAAETQ